MKINNKYGICFYIIGLSGSGKSTIGKLIKRNIEKKYGKTILIHGDEIRSIYNLKGYICGIYKYNLYLEICNTFVKVWI